MVPVILLAVDGDPSALQPVFDRAYDEGPYSRVVRSGEARIIPPLRPEQLEWAQARLRLQA